MKTIRSLKTVISSVACALLLVFSAAGHAVETAKAPQAKPAKVTAVVAPVNINTADVQLLAALDGVGEKKAADIVAYRDANGKFSKVEDLLKVKGIGEKTLEKNRSVMTIN